MENRIFFVTSSSSSSFVSYRINDDMLADFIKKFNIDFRFEGFDYGESNGSYFYVEIEDEPGRDYFPLEYSVIIAALGISPYKLYKEYRDVLKNLESAKIKTPYSEYEFKNVNDGSDESIIKLIHELFANTDFVEKADIITEGNADDGEEYEIWSKIGDFVCNKEYFKIGNNNKIINYEAEVNDESVIVYYNANLSLHDTTSFRYSNKDVKKAITDAVEKGIDGVSEIYIECENVTEIEIPDGVTSLDFNECTSLESVIISDSVTDIGKFGFQDCSSLESIKVSENNKSYASIDGVLYNKNLNEIIHVPENIKKVTIPDSVTIIKDYAFSWHEKLESITISNSVTKIGDKAFKVCTNLENVTIPDSVTNIGKEAFCWCENLESLTIGNGVTSIGEGAFKNCKKLENVHLPDKVINILPNAFMGTKWFNKIKKGKTLVVINEMLVDGKKSIDDVVVPDNVKLLCSNAFKNNKKVTSIVISSGVEKIEVGAFEGCINLQNVTIPESVTSIGEGAFKNCCSLINMNISEKNKEYCIVDGVLFNKDKSELIICLKDKKGSYLIPNCVKNIGIGAFKDCTNLESITIPDSIKSIGKQAFKKCTNLKEIVLTNKNIKILKSDIEKTTKIVYRD